MEPGFSAVGERLEFGGFSLDDSFLLDTLGISGSLL